MAGGNEVGIRNLKKHNVRDMDSRYKGITTYMVQKLGAVVTGQPFMGLKGGAQRGSNKKRGIAVDVDISSTVESPPKQLRTVEGTAICNALHDHKLRLVKTQVKYVCHRRNLVAITDGVAIHTKTGKEWLVEWKCGYVARRHRQQRFNLPGLEKVYDNAQNRALLQLSAAMTLSGVKRGILLYTNRTGTVRSLLLPKSLPEMGNMDTANKVLDALCSKF